MATNSPRAPSRAYNQNNTTQAVNQNPELRQERTLVLEGLGQGYRAQTHSRTSQGTLKYQDAPHRVQSQNRAERTPLTAGALLPRGTSPLSSPLPNSINSMLCAGEISQTSTPVIDPTPSIDQTLCQYSILHHQFHTIPSLLPRATSRIRLTSSPISSSISAPATTSSTQSTQLPPSISEGSPPLPDQSSTLQAPLTENANQRSEAAPLLGDRLSEENKTASASAVEAAQHHDPELINKEHLRQAINLTKAKLGPHDFENLLKDILTQIYDIAPYPIPEKVTDDYILNTIAYGLELNPTWTHQTQIPTKKIKLLRKHSGDIWKFYIMLNDDNSEIPLNLERNAQEYTPQQSSNIRCQGSKTKIKFGADRIIPQHILPYLSHLNSAAKVPKGILKKHTVKNNFIIIEAPTRHSLINNRVESDQLSLRSHLESIDKYEISISQLEDDLRQKRCNLFKGTERNVYIYSTGIGYKIYRHIRDDMEMELSYDLRLNDIYQSKCYGGKIAEFANVEICNILDDSPRARVKKTIKEIKAIKFKHKGFEQLASSDRIPLSLVK